MKILVTGNFVFADSAETSDRIKTPRKNLTTELTSENNKVSQVVFFAKFFDLYTYLYFRDELSLKVHPCTLNLITFKE